MQPRCSRDKQIHPGTGMVAEAAEAAVIRVSSHTLAGCEQAAGGGGGEAGGGRGRGAAQPKVLRIRPNQRFEVLAGG